MLIEVKWRFIRGTGSTCEVAIFLVSVNSLLLNKEVKYKFRGSWGHGLFLCGGESVVTSSEIVIDYYGWYT